MIECRKSLTFILLAHCMLVWWRPDFVHGQLRESPSARKNGPSARFVEPIPLTEQQKPLTKPRTLAFQGVTPGKTSRDELIKAVGKSQRRIRRGKSDIWQYQIAPFQRVDIEVREKKVRAIVVRLKKPISVDQAAVELKIADLENAEIWKSDGVTLLGVVFPDRGILLRFGNGDGKVTQIVIEPLSAEPFLLRVEQDAKHRYTMNLADLRQAARLQPRQARIPLWKTRILASVGRYGEADQSIRRALQLAKGELQLECRVVRASVLMALDQVEKANQDIDAAIKSARAETRGRGQFLKGELIAGTRGDYQAAIKFHMAAIQSVGKLAKSTTEPKRAVSALHVLVDAHFAAARDIANGRWKNQRKTALNWLNRATQLSERLFERTGDAGIRLRAKVQTLEIYAIFGDKKLDPGAMIRQAAELGKKISGESTDPLFRQQLVWQLAKALGHAGETESRRRRYRRAIQYLTNAVTLRDALQSERPMTVLDRHQRGVECFTLGSVHAMQQGNHRESQLWFNQARIHLPKQMPAILTSQLRLHGDRLVAMGVAYWKIGDRPLGLKLTREGKQHLEAAVSKKLAKPDALIIPYNNLAGMLRTQGEEVEADSLSERAAALQRRVK